MYLKWEWISLKLLCECSSMSSMTINACPFLSAAHSISSMQRLTNNTEFENIYCFFWFGICFSTTFSLNLTHNGMWVGSSLTMYTGMCKNNPLNHAAEMRIGTEKDLYLYPNVQNDMEQTSAAAGQCTTVPTAANAWAVPTAANINLMTFCTLGS